MAHIEKRGAGRWRARYIGPDGRERSKTFERKVDAERFLATTQADLLRGRYVDPHDRTTVTEYARRWASARAHRPSTARRVALSIEKHIAGTSLGGRRLASVLPSDVQAWASDRAQVLSPSTLKVLVGLLSSIYASAVLDRLVPSSPVVRLSLPASRRKRVVPLTVEEVRRLITATPPQYRALVVVQAGAGLRIGEVLALRAQDVDWLRRVVRVDRQFSEVGHVITAPKTPTSRRAIPLPQVVAEALAEHVRAFEPAPDGSLFHDRGRLHRHNHYGSGVFRRAVAATGLAAGTSSHDLRHHYASVLLAAGESVVAVAERLGHENAGLVLSTYGHLMPDSEDRTRRAIDDAWRPTADGLGTALG